MFKVIMVVIGVIGLGVIGYRSLKASPVPVAAAVARKPVGLAGATGAGFAPVDNLVRTNFVTVTVTNLVEPELISERFKFRVGTVVESDVDRYELGRFCRLGRVERVGEDEVLIRRTNGKFLRVVFGNGPQSSPVEARYENSLPSIVGLRVPAPGL